MKKLNSMHKLVIFISYILMVCASTAIAGDRPDSGNIKYLNIFVIMDSGINQLRFSAC